MNIWSDNEHLCALYVWFPCVFILLFMCLGNVNIAKCSLLLDTSYCWIPFLNFCKQIWQICILSVLVFFLKRFPMNPFSSFSKDDVDTCCRALSNLKTVDACDLVSVFPKLSSVREDTLKHPYSLRCARHQLWWIELNISRIF